MDVIFLLKQKAKEFIAFQHTLLVITLLLLGALSVQAQNTATVITDKDDYSPGQYVIVSGTGWAPGETVSFDFHETPQVCTSDHHVRSTIAEEDGSILYDQFLINEKHLGVAFVLTATGQSSGHTATTNFTDAGIKNVVVRNDAASVTSLCTGQNINVTFRAVSNEFNQYGNFGTENTFVAELSNSNGSFSSPILIGSIKSRHDNNNDQTISGSIPTDLIYGTGYRIRVRSTQPSTNNPDNGINLTINTQPIDALAGTDQPNIAGTSTSLAANTPTVGAGEWSIVSGTSGSFSSTSNPTATFTGNAGTSYILRWTITNGGCTSADDVTISFSSSNPIPVLTSISPINKAVGDAAFTLIAIGNNFLNSSIIYFNGSPRSTIFVSGTQLTASISASDLATAGVNKITVFTPTPGGGTSNEVDFTVNQAQPVISWPAAGTISYGTTLEGKLNASANYGENSVAGTFVYRADGMVINNSSLLNAKYSDYVLTVEFTPTDDLNYKSASRTNAIKVNKAATETVVTIAEGVFTYNGSAHTPATVRVTGAGGLDLTPEAA
ncbi:hypothetical protein K3G39_17010, partial [Pontibacter sp. HSC-14F20]|uniref:hypothetical protein n=1 Tax=Pontibacter sp. HSC-14F20 TaxID=2864136 RepID=UPI001C736FD5